MILDSNDIIGVRTYSGYSVETKYYTARDLLHSLNGM